jgi:hypothetical protein
MTREFDFPAPRRETSALQARLNNIAKLEALEKPEANMQAVHAHSLIEAFDPTGNRAVSHQAHELREGIEEEIKPL